MKIESTNEIYCIGARVLIKVEKIKDLTDGGIALPQSLIEHDQDKVSEGQIIGYGKTAFTDICGEKETPPKGAYVYFVKFAGKAISIDEDEYRIINDEDIYAVRKNGVENELLARKKEEANKLLDSLDGFFVENANVGNSFSCNQIQAIKDFIIEFAGKAIQVREQVTKEFEKEEE